MTQTTVKFLLNGEPCHLDSNSTITQTVLNFIRETKQLKGTKEGCAEGDCGACTVVIGELVNDKLRLQAVNSCIQFAPTLRGKALFTVEYLCQKKGDLHPVQQSLVDHHGSQCGFCTPGFVMSLWNVYVDHQAQQTVPSNKQIRSALSGNLCRCTGYRPILEAGEAMLSFDPVEFDQASIESALRAIQPQATSFDDGHNIFSAPETLNELMQLRSRKPGATLLAGATDIGLWVNKQFRNLGDIIYIGNVPELKQITEDNEHITIGAATTLTDAFEAIAKFYPEIQQQWERFASTPIRNAATLGGNIANGSPIGDLMPWLITLETKVVLGHVNGKRTLALEDLYLDYMKQDRKADEIVESIIIPKPQPNQAFRTYKLSKRYDSDISAVCAAFRITLENSIISDIRIAFGGMAATPKRAAKTEQLLLGKAWDETTAKHAMSMLTKDYNPLADMRASASNRLQSAQNLLFRFYLESREKNPLSAVEVSVFS